VSTITRQRFEARILAGEHVKGIAIKRARLPASEWPSWAAGTVDSAPGRLIFVPTTGYSNATPSGSFSANHRSAASSLVKTLPSLGISQSESKGAATQRPPAG
jgi:hypothetical protein